MSIKRIILIIYLEFSTLVVFAQQWVWDEIADEQRENGSDTTPIPGLFFIGLILYGVYLWDQHKKEKKYAQEIRDQKKQEEEALERINKEKRKSEDLAKKKAKVLAQEKLKEKTREKIVVDLGLSVLWADRNLFATSSTDKGAMFAWGDNEIKEEHNYSGAILNEKSSTTLANIINNDKKNICGNKSFDPATNNWGGQWRLPQSSEFKELLLFCEWTWESRNNVNGYKITGKNGNSIFLPLTGTHVGKDHTDPDNGYYWTGIGSSVSTEAKCLNFINKWHVVNDTKRWHGCAVRPVWAEPEPTIDEIILTINNKLDIWGELTPIQKYETYKTSFKITKSSISNDIIEDLDRHACYSEDGKKLESIFTGAGRDEKWPSLIPRYGTKIICDRAYDDLRNRFLENPTLEIPNSVYAIGNSAFEYLSCNKIILPQSLKYLTGNPLTNKYTKIVSYSPYYKVDNNSLLSSDGILFVANMNDMDSKITVPEKVEIIGRNAFYSNKKLEHLVIAESVLALSDLFLQGCDNLRIIEFLGAIQIIDNYTFNGCKQIKVIIVPDEFVHYYQGILPAEFTNLVRPKSSIIDEEKTIEQIAIENDAIKSSLDSIDSFIYIPSSEDYALIKKYKDKCKKTFIKQNEWDDAIIDWGTHEDEKHESWENGDANYSQDGTKLLRHFAEENTYTIKDGVKILCDYAFADSQHIKKIIIPKSVTCLGDMLFYSPDLKYFRIPKSIRTITGNPFVGCDIRLTCDSSYFVIERDALYDKDKQILISIYNGEKYRSIIHVNPNIKIIGRNAFHGVFLDSTTPFIIPNEVIYIADEAFADTKFDLKLPNKLIEIGDSAFEDSYIKEINIPDSVQKIGKQAFSSCEKLIEVSLPKHIKTIEKETFRGCENLLKIHIPAGCKAIREMAFWSCYKLVDVYLPDSLEIIEKNAFGNGYLTSVVVSRKTKIEDEAFPKKCKIIFRD